MAPVRVLAVVVAAGVVLSGCAGGGGSTPAPSGVTLAPTVSASVSPTPSPSVSVPVAAQEHTEAGAVAFVRFYIDLVNSATLAPASGVLGPYSDPECVACKNITAEIERLAQDRQRYASSALSVPDLQVTSQEADGRWLLSMTLVQARTDVLGQTGAVVDVVNADTFDRRVALMWGEDRWVMYGME